jgi:hypothetical protein
MSAIRVCFLIAVPIGLVVFAQQNPELTSWMKDADSASSALRKLEKKTGEQAVESAEDLGGIYEEMIGFWRQRDARNAVKWSEEGKAAAVELASAANAGDAVRAESAWKALGGTCKSCHDMYREKLPDGKYRIKDRPQQ